MRALVSSASTKTFVNAFANAVLAKQPEKRVSYMIITFACILQLDLMIEKSYPVDG